MDKNLKRKIEKVTKNNGDVSLAQLETTIDLMDKIEELKSAIESIPETIIPEYPEYPEHPEFPSSFEVTNIPEVQKVELINPPKEKDDKEQLKLLKQIADELKKKEDYAYDIEIDAALKEQLKGEPGAPGEKGKDGTEITGVEIAGKLESLPEEEKLDISAVKGAEDLIIDIVKEKISKIPKPKIITGISGSSLTVTEPDGSPSVSNVSTIQFPNGSVTDNGGGNVTVNPTAMSTLVRNSTGSTIYRGMIVYMSGSTGNRPNITKARANSEATSARTFGVVVDDISNNSDGYVLNIGALENLDTRTSATHPFTSDTLSDGDTVYLDPDTAGYITNVKPVAPNHLVYVGKVVRTHPNQGYIVYQFQNGYELDEIHDVLISSPTDGQVLTYDSATSLWKNETFSGGSGIAESFETVSKNLDASDATLIYTGDNLTSIEYANGITKTFSYTGDNLTSVVLSGSTPSGISLTKTLTYTGDNLTGVAYS